jgi:hypothetical protein
MAQILQMAFFGIFFVLIFEFVATQASLLMKARRPGSGKSEPRPRALDQSKAGWWWNQEFQQELMTMRRRVCESIFQLCSLHSFALALSRYHLILTYPILALCLRGS